MDNSGNSGNSGISGARVEGIGARCDPGARNLALASLCMPPDPLTAYRSARTRASLSSQIDAAISAHRPVPAPLYPISA